MNILEAIEQMKEGVSVKREYWPSDHKINAEMLNRGELKVDWDDLTAEDWEICS